MSQVPSGMYQTTYTTTPATFVNVDAHVTRPITPNRYTISHAYSPGPAQIRSTAFGTYTSNELYGAPGRATGDLQGILGKSVGTFGQAETRSVRAINGGEFSVTQANQVTDLNNQVRRLTEKSDQLFNENRALKRDSEALIICRGRLEEKESEVKKLLGDNKFHETTIGNLRVELERAYQQNKTLSTQIADMFNKNPGRFHMDINSQKIMSAEEYEMECKIRELQDKLITLEKERDRLFVENYEFKKLHGEEIDALEPDDLMGARYHNGLQITNLDLNKAKRKVEALQTENDLLRNELNILRGIDCFEENDVKSGLIRADDQTVWRDRTAATGQRSAGPKDRSNETGTGTGPEFVGRDRPEERGVTSHWK